MTPSAPPGNEKHQIDELSGDETEGYYLEGYSTQATDDPGYDGGIYGWFCMELENWAQVQEQLKQLGFTEHEGHLANRRSMTT